MSWGWMFRIPRAALRGRGRIRFRWPWLHSWRRDDPSGGRPARPPCTPPARQVRRAFQAAVTALSGRGLATPKVRDGLVESMQILLTERSSARKARGAAMNQTHALLVTAPEQIRATYRNIGSMKLFAALTRSRRTPGHGPEQTLRGSVKRLAVRHQQHTSDIDDIDTRLGELAAQVNPALLQLPGVGPLVASQLLVACGDNPERLSSEQQFAALCGTAPIPASSGKYQAAPALPGR
ncbi:MAG: hypothetical protein EOP32_03770 [Rhodococcus sp. (in: high G+C Gram-positive bacteria)]|nr:MAG: hypothetical protein EOP32_03770 [Rhodococcus sp. (in: high G+C Gram-positive bacteria)]